MAEPSTSTSASAKKDKEGKDGEAEAEANERSLRDHILEALAGVPGTRDFHLHVLVSSPRKAGTNISVSGTTTTTTTVFPFAKPRPPRIYVQDILLLLSEQVADGPRVLVSAVEAYTYVVPSTECVVLYVSKVDSTGHGARGEMPSPTRTLVQALLGYYLDPETRPVEARHVWVQLFARAQTQYLFPNSGEWEGKKPLSDKRLCLWWRRVLGEAARAVGKKEGVRTKMYYVLPGYSAEEAAHALGGAGEGWMYGHPYAQKEIPLPCARPSEGHNLGHYIPSFEDDPKARFMDEMAYTTDGEIRSPVRKRARTETGTTAHTTEDSRPLGELSTVGVDEFWERMSFRQECVAGAVTGFFTVLVSSGCKKRAGGPLAPGRGQVSVGLKKRVLSTLMTGVEFSTAERAIAATETVEGAIRGLCEDMSRARTPPPRTNRRLLEPPKTPPRKRGLAEEVSPNPFPEPVASVSTYRESIYGLVSTRNAVAGRSESAAGAVRMLTVRRKKKG
uniref:histone acetyltransferase n=1 Tax=Psilocybe cubensis TaxID=181762 RepID=A0A8H7XRA5_PSICU